jgi:hypothetical protein
LFSSCSLKIVAEPIFIWGAYQDGARPRFAQSATAHLKSAVLNDPPLRTVVAGAEECFQSVLWVLA